MLHALHSQPFDASRGAAGGNAAPPGYCLGGVVLLCCAEHNHATERVQHLVRRGSPCVAGSLLLPLSSSSFSPRCCLVSAWPRLRMTAVPKSSASTGARSRRPSIRNTATRGSGP